MECCAPTVPEENVLTTMIARYPYVHVDVAADDAELLSAELFELGASGLEERDATTLLKPDGVSAQVTLIASFDSEAAAQAACDELAPRFAARIEHVEGDGWRDGWRAYFKPTRVGTRLVVKPSWEAYAPAPDDVVLTIDPANAFGTGTHETTRLVLAELEALVVPGCDVLDIGAGSGILAIAACLLGAARARALDIDDESERACRENAELNGVGARIAASQTPVQSLSEQYPLVLANIETRILVPLAAVVGARVEPGGTLVLSGILPGEVESVVAAYPSFEVLARRELGEWAAVVLRKSSSAQASRA
jgi:ribosomal protein L11 methyltransferase